MAHLLDTCRGAALDITILKNIYTIPDKFVGLKIHTFGACLKQKFCLVHRLLKYSTYLFVKYIIIFILNLKIYIIKINKIIHHKNSIFPVVNSILEY